MTLLRAMQEMGQATGRAALAMSNLTGTLRRVGTTPRRSRGWRRHVRRMKQAAR